MAQAGDINKMHIIYDKDGVRQMGTKLHQAIARHDGKEVKKLLRQGADPNKQRTESFTTDDLKDHLSGTPLVTAMYMGSHEDIFHPSAYPNKRTPPHEMVKDLLKAGANPNLGSVPPVFAARYTRDHRSLRHLIDHGADISGLPDNNPTLLRAKDEILASKHKAAKLIQNKFRDAVVNPETRYGQIRLANDYKAVHSKVFDNSLKTMDQLIAASDRKKAFEKQAPRKITKAHESPFGNRKKYSRKNKKN